MPLEHMVWIRFKPGVSEERREHHLNGLRSLKAKVPGITRLTAGPSITDRAAGYTHGLLVTLENEAALKIYADHPEHVKVAGPLKEDADLMAMDVVG